MQRQNRILGSRRAGVQISQNGALGCLRRERTVTSAWTRPVITTVTVAVRSNVLRRGPPAGASVAVPCECSGSLRGASKTRVKMKGEKLQKESPGSPYIRCTHYETPWSGNFSVVSFRFFGTTALPPLRGLRLRQSTVGRLGPPGWSSSVCVSRLPRPGAYQSLPKPGASSRQQLSNSPFVLLRLSTALPSVFSPFTPPPISPIEPSSHIHIPWDSTGVGIGPGPGCQLWRDEVPIRSPPGSFI